MNNENPQNIIKAQAEYQELIVNYKKLYDEEISTKTIAMFLDEIKCFWLERLELIGFELEELSKTNSCFLLCGAIYLDVFNYEQYYFKSLGDYHLLFDPFLKMESFFRAPEEKINAKETIDYFKKVLADTLEILAKYKDYFYILPIRELAIKDDEQHYELLEKFFLNFISSSFKKEFVSQDDFCNRYQTFEQIESEMDPYVCKNLLFDEPDLREMPLRKKIEHCCETQMNFEELTRGQSEPRMFLIAVYSWLTQIIDILLICAYLGINPYIRFNITFHYLALIMYTFVEDQYLKEMIEKTIIFYIFRKTIDAANFEKREFSEYFLIIKGKNILNNILVKIREQQIDIFKGGIKRVELIIHDEFAKYFSTA